MPLEVRKSPAAEDDLIEIWIYTEAHWGASQADLYLDAIDEALRRVSEHPESGSDCSDVRAGYRKVAAGAHRAYYRVRGNTIEVMRVLHSSRDVRRRLK